jgi:hypothetical protein
MPNGIGVHPGVAFSMRPPSPIVFIQKPLQDQGEVSDPL